jgi:hypothetical protein
MSHQNPGHDRRAPRTQGKPGEHEPRRRASDRGEPAPYDGPDRRSKDIGSPSGLERRRGPGRRLSDFTKAAEEGELTKEQFLFVMAIEEFKRANAKVYPSWTDVLEVVRLLGYRKVQKTTLNLRAAEDFTEHADAPPEVRPKRFEEREAA